MCEDGFGFAAFIIKCGYAIGIEPLPGAFFDAHDAFRALVVKVGDYVHAGSAFVTATERDGAVEIEMIGLVVINELFDSFCPVVLPRSGRVMGGPGMGALTVVGWI